MSVEPHQMRVIEEARDLDARVAALCKFLRTLQAKALPVIEIHAMYAQLTAMESYLSALRVRLRLWSIDDDAYTRVRPKEPEHVADRSLWIHADTYRAAFDSRAPSQFDKFAVRKLSEYDTKEGLIELRPVDIPA